MSETNCGVACDAKVMVKVVVMVVMVVMATKTASWKYQYSR